MRFAKFTALFELLSEKYCVLLFVIVLKKWNQSAMFVTKVGAANTSDQEALQLSIQRRCRVCICTWLPVM